MKIAERIVMVLIVVVLVGGVAWIYFGIQYQRAEINDAVARGEYQIALEEPQVAVEPEDWREIYPKTLPIVIAGVSVEASVADTLSSRIKGLSDTPFLPDNVVKLFAFGAAGSHSIWMKDMNYALDILWVAQDGTIVHIEEEIAPETFPEAFSSPTPAWYVVEAAAGFVAKHNVVVGDTVKIPVP